MTKADKINFLTARIRSLEAANNDAFIMGERGRITPEFARFQSNVNEATLKALRIILENVEAEDAA